MRVLIELSKFFYVRQKKIYERQSCKTSLRSVFFYQCQICSKFELTVELRQETEIVIFYFEEELGNSSSCKKYKDIYQIPWQNTGLSNKCLKPRS